MGITRVTKNILIGEKYDVLRKNFAEIVKSFQITTVFNVDRDSEEEQNTCLFSGVGYVHSSVTDYAVCGREEFIKELNNAHAKLTEIFTKNSKEVVLVHCMVGEDRSPFVVAYFLSKKWKIGLDRAYKIVKKTRPFVHEHPEWLKALRGENVDLVSKYSTHYGYQPWYWPKQDGWQSRGERGTGTFEIRNSKKSKHGKPLFLMTKSNNIQVEEKKRILSETKNEIKTCKRCGNCCIVKRCEIPAMHAEALRYLVMNEFKKPPKVGGKDILEVCFEYKEKILPNGLISGFFLPLTKGKRCMWLKKSGDRQFSCELFWNKTSEKLVGFAEQAVGKEKGCQFGSKPIETKIVPMVYRNGILELVIE